MYHTLCYITFINLVASSVGMEQELAPKVSVNIIILNVPKFYYKILLSFHFQMKIILRNKTSIESWIEEKVNLISVSSISIKH